MLIEYIEFIYFTYTFISIIIRILSESKGIDARVCIPSAFWEKTFESKKKRDFLWKDW